MTTDLEQEMPLNVILQGNVLDVLRKLPPKKFKTIITSSPYFGLRFYGTALQVWDGKPECLHKWQVKVKNQHAGRGDGQKSGKYSEQGDYPDIKVKSARCTKCQAWMGELGQEPTRGMFLGHLWQICDLLMQLLEDDGTLWFNIGDGRDNDGSLMNVPHMFVEGMKARGWIWLDDVQWFKRSVLPQSDPTVFSPDHEPVFHFAKKDAPTFYANGRLGIMQREEPPGVDGKEGRDWRWVEREKEPKNRNKKKIKGVWHVKASLWKPYTYFHETQYEPLAESSLKQINQLYKGQSKKHTLAQSTLDDHRADGVQNPSDVKRRIIESMRIRHGLPRFGGNKADGYSNGTYSGKEWTPDLPKNLQRQKGDAGGGSSFQNDSGSLNSKGELVGQAGGRFMRNTWVDLPPNDLPSDLWDIIPARFADAHFAVFPQELVMRCLRTSCPREVCTKCGLGWRKMYSEERKATRPGKNTNKGKSGTNEDPNAALHNSELSRKRETIIRREVGIMKCACNAPTRPGAVLDPFMGSGTTAIAAILLALWWLGIELSEEFIKLAMKRLVPYLTQSKLL